MNICFHLNIGCPTHATVLVWIKKQGISQFRSHAYYANEKWVLIAVESIQFGNKKILLVLAVPERRCREGKALTYADAVPLVLKVSASWKGDEIASEIKQSIDLEQISYCISDTGSNLICAFNSLNCTHIPDINHKISRMIQSVLEKNPLFIQYTKDLALLRKQKSMSKIARIVPPNQRVMCRFMNLLPLFEWGVNMTLLLKKNLLNEEEKPALSFIEPLSAFIIDTYMLLNSLSDIQTLLKVKGYNNESKKESLSILSTLKSDNALKIKKQVRAYFSDLSFKAKGETICCSSDIIESSFGKYKEIVKGNKTVGISDLCLCIATMMGTNLNDTEKLKNAMESVKTKNVKEWKEINISKTLFAEKNELFKNIERISSYRI
ncbi:MAG: hypothetical protein LBE79_13385 [Tannerella sp.]|nr:hypothetical protein [Tannerella sp.]